ncbi:MAG: hypothetical protein JOY83_23295, partial [Alphaproteobacteria bacterium]|nr:hypothetical protein [Alphaproteobacteria bacterium]
SERDTDADPLRRVIELFPEDPQQVAFWQALGRFLDAYAAVETLLNVLDQMSA